MQDYSEKSLGKENESADLPILHMRGVSQQNYVSASVVVASTLAAV